MVTITLYAKQKKRHRCTEQTFRLCGRRSTIYFYASFLGIKIFNHLESTSGKEFQHLLNIPWVMLLI